MAVSAEMLYAELERRVEKVSDEARETRADLRAHIASCAVGQQSIREDLKFIKALLYRVAWGILIGLFAACGNLLYMLAHQRGLI